MAPPRNLGKLKFFHSHLNKQYFLSYKLCNKRSAIEEKKEPRITLGKYSDD